jgi:hypothetical protein
MVLNEELTPLGRPEAVRVTSPAYPLENVTETVDWLSAPEFELRETGGAEMV